MTDDQAKNNDPVVRRVTMILEQAIQCSASDVHCEPVPAGVRIRYRIDGVLHEQEIIDLAIANKVASRLKVLANLDITEKRIPQDGKFQVLHRARPIDLRISTFPSLYGEKIVVRILDQSRMALNVRQLGFSSSMLAAFQSLINRSNGFFLVAGPTGSGKTTTLYAALASLNTPAKNTITLEDPIEYNVAGITQGQINTDVGFTFAKGIRSILRQDPDIVMVGEIRDKETAQTAIEAALTGHIVLSTIHTNDAPTVIMRLMDMGIEPFLINAAITGILAQRLARKICDQCKSSYTALSEEKDFFKQHGHVIANLYKGKGCTHCRHTGYKGRIGVFQLLAMSHDLRKLIVQKPSFESIVAQAKVEGMKLLIDDGIEKARDGIISFQELLRVLM